MQIKTTKKYCYIPRSIANIKIVTPDATKGVEKMYILLGSVQNGISTLRKSLVVSYTVKPGITI